MKTLLMPKVETCDATDCAYNVEGVCHTMAINVAGPTPTCNTYTPGESKAGIEFIVAGVGSCSMKDCVYNEHLECTQENVHIAGKGDQTLCNSYTQR